MKEIESEYEWVLPELDFNKNSIVIKIISMFICRNTKIKINKVADECKCIIKFQGYFGQTQ